MAIIWLEICLISARGLRRTSSLWKLQWFSVGWVDPNNKYCTKVDSSGNANPNWKTKFSTMIDTSDPKFKDLALNVEVYSREPIFLGERLEGSARVLLKEFVDKYAKKFEDVGSFQLRKGNSSKPQGFVDISIRVSEEKEDSSSSSSSSFIPIHGNDEGFKLSDHNDTIELSNNYDPTQAYPPKPPFAAHTPSFPPNYSNSSLTSPSYLPPAGYGYQPPQNPPMPPGPSYRPPRTPPPPPPPANVGYIPTFLPRTDNLPPSYVNMPPSGAGQGRGGGAGFGMGLGAGALAAGAVIFGDDFMSGFDFPGGLQDPTLIISTDPPF